VFQPFQATAKGRAFGRGSRQTLVLEYGLASGFLQRGKLQRWVLVIGRDAGVAVFHAAHFDPDI
jgi:hypothetical protein